MPINTDTRAKVSVAIVGAGLAGLTAALKLAQRGYAVTVYEADEVAGGNLSCQHKGGVYHDVYPHMYCDWYRNFWALVEDDLKLDRERHFEKRTHVKIKYEGHRDFHTLANPSSLGAVLANMRSGFMPAPDMFLYGYAMVDLAARRFRPGSLLGSTTVKGFLYSRYYASQRSVSVFDLVLREIWSIDGARTSAHAFHKFSRHNFTFPVDTPYAWMLKGNHEENLVCYIEQALAGQGCTLTKRCTVKEILPTTSGVQLTMHEHGKPPMAKAFDFAILAVPPAALAELVVSAGLDRSIVDQVPELSYVGQLRSDPILVADLYFKKRLPDIPKEHFALYGSRGDLTVIDLAQLWTAKAGGNTTLVLAASDSLAYPRRSNDEDGFLMVSELHRYLPVFAAGTRWGDPNSDIDWQKSTFIPNDTHRLYVNEVTTDVATPEPAYEQLPTIFFAGDYCDNQVGMATVEAAVLSGINAARALQKRHSLGSPIVPLEFDSHGEWTLLALKLAMAPGAYWAKVFSLFIDATRVSADAPARPVRSAVRALRLPSAFAMDCFDTVVALTASVVLQPKDHPGDTSGPYMLGGEAELLNRVRNVVEAIAEEVSARRPFDS